MDTSSISRRGSNKHRPTLLPAPSTRATVVVGSAYLIFWLANVRGAATLSFIPRARAPSARDGPHRRGLTAAVTSGPRLFPSQGIADRVRTREGRHDALFRAQKDTPASNTKAQRQPQPADKHSRAKSQPVLTAEMLYGKRVRRAHMRPCAHSPAHLRCPGSLSLRTGLRLRPHPAPWLRPPKKAGWAHDQKTCLTFRIL